MAGMGNGVKKQRKTLKIRSPPRSLSIENYSDSRITNRGLKRYRKKENFFPTIFVLGTRKISRDRRERQMFRRFIRAHFRGTLFHQSFSFFFFVSFIFLSLSLSLFSFLFHEFNEPAQNLSELSAATSSGIMIFSILAVHGPGFRGKSRVSLRVLRSFSEEGPLGWLGCFIRKGGDR